MSYKVKLISWEDATPEQRDLMSEDYDLLLQITNCGRVSYYCDSMEPEDANFRRDLSWVLDELRRAYRAGVMDSLDRAIAREDEQ